MAKKSLVTGGAGFIGAHVVNHLIRLGHEVIVIDDLSGGFEKNVNPKAKLIVGSINDQQLLGELFESNSFNYIYHLAAYAAEGLSHFIRNFNYNNNLIGSINLINLAIKYDVECFVFTSSIAVYGGQEPPMVESSLPTPEDPYGIAKYAVEMDLKAAHEMFGLNFVIFRPHNVYGPYQNIGDRYRNVIGIFMNQLLQGKPLSIFGDGAQTRAFSDIDDVAPHIANSVNIKGAYNQIFNIGGDQEYSVKELAYTVMETMNIKGSIQFHPARNEVVHAYADHSKVRRIFVIDQSSYVPLSAGLEKMAAWVNQEGIRKAPKFNGIEVVKSLPEFWLED